MVVESVESPVLTNESFDDVVKVPQANLYWLEQKLEKLNKRARKLGLSPVVLEQTGKEVVEYVDEHGFNKSYVVILVTVRGETPKLYGWQFLATLQHVTLEVEGEDGKVTEQKSVIVRAAPGVGDIDAKYRHADPRQCDQCHKIRYRIDTFVLRHEDGREVQVGRQCLGDFLGGADPKALVDAASFLRDLEAILEESESYGSERNDGRYWNVFDTKQFVAYAFAAMDRFGWVSRKAQYNGAGTATCDRVVTRLNPPTPVHKCPSRSCILDKFGCEYEFAPNEAQEEEAEKAIEWAKNLTDDEIGASDYLYNLHVIAGSRSIPEKNEGLIASLPQAYRRALGQKIEREARKQAAITSEYVGEVGSKIVVNATVTHIRDIESRWGATTLYTLVDDKGNVINWFCSANVSLKQGVKYTLSGTVKKHEEYKGVKQTTLTRCKLLK